MCTLLRKTAVRPAVLPAEPHSVHPAIHAAVQPITTSNAANFEHSELFRQFNSEEPTALPADWIRVVDPAEQYAQRNPDQLVRVVANLERIGHHDGVRDGLLVLRHQVDLLASLRRSHAKYS